MLRPRSTWQERLVDRLDVTKQEAAAMIAQVAFIADLTRLPVEDYFIAGVRLCHWGSTSAASPANTSQLGLFNPTTNDDPVIAITQWMVVQTGGVNEGIVFREHVTALGQLSGSRFSDRQYGTGVGGRITGHSDNTQVGQQGTDGRLAIIMQQTALWLPLQYILPPLTGFSWASAAINRLVGFASQWREFDLRVR